MAEVEFTVTASPQDAPRLGTTQTLNWDDDILRAISLIPQENRPVAYSMSQEVAEGTNIATKTGINLTVVFELTRMDFYTEFIDSVRDFQTVTLDLTDVPVIASTQTAKLISASGYKEIACTHASVELEFKALA